jgi:hypothetical protein
MAYKSAGVPKGPPLFLEYSEDRGIRRVKGLMMANLLAI